MPSNNRNKAGDALKVLSILLVVFLHSGNSLPSRFTQGAGVEDDLALLCMHWISNGLTRIAVPIFFMLSGYFVMLKIIRSGKFDYRTMLQERTRTILVPYLMWSLIVFLIFAIVQIPELTHRYFNRSIISDMSFHEMVNVIFFEPIPYQLWFLRDLFFIFVFFPVLRKCVGSCSLVFLPLLLILWLFDLNFGVATEGLFFFSIGLYGAAHLPKGATRGELVLLIALWFSLAIVAVFLRLSGHSSGQFLYKVQILVGVFAIVQVARAGGGEWMAKYSKYAFPVFLFHEPALMLMKKLALAVTTRSAFGDLALFFGVPLVVIFISIVAADLASRFGGRLYTLLIGGRVRDESVTRT